MEFSGKGQPLTRIGLVKSLEVLGLEPSDSAYIWAVVQVETASVTQGFGFRVDRRPQILFERHKFREFTDGRFDENAPDISGPPGAYGTFAEQYVRLEKAIELCEAANLGLEPALQAASWGMGQIMGFNFESAGFTSAEKMVERMTTGEDAQLMAMVSFLVDHGLGKLLLRKDWAGFAKKYNGSQYWRNRYDVKLEQQYARFASGSTPNLEIRAAQAALLMLGYSPGQIDGVLGSRTRGALRNFCIAQGMMPNEELDGPIYTALCERVGINP